MKAIVAVLVIAGVIVGLLVWEGVFDSSKVGPDTEVRAPKSAGNVPSVEVVAKTIGVYSEAVGTVRSRRKTRVSPRLMGTLVELKVEQGDEVTKGQVLARIDDREVKARVEAARAVLAQTDARYSQAAAAQRRYTDLYEKNATTKEQLEAVTGEFEMAKAGVEGARAAVREAEVYLDHTTILSEIGGVVAEKLAEPGDLALPGKPILILQDPNDLRLEADVREYLIADLPVGASVTLVFGEPLNSTIESVIEERAPEADPGTRTFLVKAPIPEGAGAQAGIFGRLRFLTGEREALLIPVSVVRRIGQLETVRVIAEDRIHVRHVRTGARHEDMVEVLSGLSAGERLVLEER
jgi:membrane fusion protein, multidrug efflux system